MTRPAARGGRWWGLAGWGMHPKSKKKCDFGAKKVKRNFDS